MTNPGDKVPALLVVLDDGGDGVMVPVEGEAVLPHIIVGKSLDKVQPEHRRQAARNTEHTHFTIENRDEVWKPPAKQHFRKVILLMLFLLPQKTSSEVSYLSGVMVLRWCCRQQLLHGPR